MDIIDGLLRIKRIRENSREIDMRVAKQQLALAAEALRVAAEQQRVRDLERTEREQSLYRDVCERIVVVRDLDDLKYEVNVMKDAGIADEKAVVDAQETRQKRRLSFDDASGAWRLAAQATRKFEDLSAAQLEEKLRHQEFMADLELEEHPNRSAMSRALEEEEA